MAVGTLFAHLNSSCVIPCAAADALAWAAGKITDKELLLESPLIPEAIFICNLPSRSEWRAGFRAMRHYFERGAVLVITRTGTDVVDDHLMRAGAVVTLKENTTPVKYRFLVPPDALKKYFARFGR